MVRRMRVVSNVLLSGSLAALALGVAAGVKVPGAGSAATASVIAPTPAWLRGWPMVGHDPQRTGLSPVLGPLHPRLLRRQSGFSADVVAPDGSIIGTAGTGPHVALAVLSMDGRLKKLSARVSYASALRQDGVILAVGADSGTAAAVSATGAPLWRRSNIGLPKTASPLVAASEQFVIAAEGHPENGTSGLWILSPDGTVAGHVSPGVPTFGVALGLDGRAYTLQDDQGSGIGQVVAYSPDWQEQWRYSLGRSLESPGDCNCLIVAPQGGVYVGDGDMLLALDAAGGRGWNVTKSDGVLAIAERPDGSLLVAGSRTLTAISGSGRRLWNADIRVHHRIGANDVLQAPSLAVDRTGTAYVGTADGRVMVIDAGGQVIARVAAGGYRYGETPNVMIGPRHILVVSGSDGTTRIYH